MAARLWTGSTCGETIAPTSCSHATDRGRSLIFDIAAVRCIVTAISCFVLCVRASSEPMPTSLVGRWVQEGTENTRGLGQSWQFRANGTVRIEYGALVISKYTYENGILTRTYPSERGKPGEVEAEKWTLTGDSLVQHAKIGDWTTEAHLVREGASLDPAKPLIGTWKYDTDKFRATMQFTRAGEAILSRPAYAYEGHYTLHGQSLLLEAKPENDTDDTRATTTEATVTRRDGEVILQTPGDAPKTFHRLAE